MAAVEPLWLEVEYSVSAWTPVLSAQRRERSCDVQRASPRQLRSLAFRAWVDCREQRRLTQTGLPWSRIVSPETGEPLASSLRAAE